MTLTDPFVAQRDKGDPAPWQVLATGKQTGGVVSFGEARLPAHTAGPGLHIHSREDETIYVISGTMTFVVGDRRFEAAPGTLVWLPREVPHVFANLGDEPVWAFGTITPAGLEDMFKEQAEYLAGLQGPPDSERIRALADKYGVRSLGPPLAV
ncbi:MAG: cupin domain-containing protein [Acidimicrobiia bacterium]|nr:cupin domain-containing protein [Acidimicrobiia bacterium]